MRGHRLGALVALSAAVAGTGAIVLDHVASTHAKTRPAPRESRPAAPAPRGGAPAPRRVVSRSPARPSPARRRLAERRRLEARIRWRSSVATGTPNSGALRDGVVLPREGVHFFTLDPVTWSSPNRRARRFGTDRLVRLVLEVVRDHRRANPGAPRVAVGDLSRERGGSFDVRHGVVGEFGPGNGTQGHVSHANGLDVDVYYPRRDGRERGPRSVDQVDRKLAQDLVDRFVAAGAQMVLTGPRLGLTGPPGVVQPTVRHDDHLHVRLPPA